MLAALKPLTFVNVKAEPVQQKRIEQIDIIWAQADGTPIWAFEVEEHTSILSALERFVALLTAAPELGKSRQLTIVAPKARRRKLQQELTSSSYIGHPQYLENKITYMFYDDFEAAFSRYSHRASLRLEELHPLCHLSTSLNN